MEQNLSPASTIILLAVALGMDTLSASIGFSQQRIRKNEIVLLGVTVGVMHIIMPLLGMTVGKYVSGIFGQIATTFSGLLLIFLGVMMVVSLLKKSEERQGTPLGIGILFFALGVSLDSFSVGLSLGLIGGAEAVFTLVTFGVVAAAMTWIGVLVGKAFHSAFGVYSQAIGAGILLIFGIRVILG